LQTADGFVFPHQGAPRKAPEPIDAEFDEITDARDKGPESSGKPMRLIKR
jgi:hypothetical protein